MGQGRKARNMSRYRALPRIPDAAMTRGVHGTQPIEAAMATKEHRRIVETPTEARQGEPGSVFALLTVSTGLAILILGVIWFVLFRT
jgi:hypothetical protein